MTAILGIQCDGCGTADLEARTGGLFDEDRFPKNGWYSISPWDDMGVAGDEFHACSANCVITIGKMFHAMSKG